MNYKLLLSINYKMFLSDTQTFVDTVNKLNENKIVSGFEIYFDDDNKFERKYAYDLAKLCHDNNYIFNIHSRVYKNKESYSNYLKFIDELTNIYGNPITLTIHPVESDNKFDSENYSKNIFLDLVSTIKMNGYKINICIENLNKLHGIDRLTIEELWNIIKDIKDLKLTHDIGHEIIDQNNYSRLYDEMLSRLTNVHMHNFKDGKDHYPITKNDSNLDLYKDVMNYLDNINYDKTLVLEYAVDYIDGNSKVEKLRSFINLANEYKEIYDMLHK
ncbi:MAG: sugar phosphate isomerase/epimerase [Clostridia bacterium]|nr:sugar phosphate isomerase/epimerase [Clostridia bacterium]